MLQLSTAATRLTSHPPSSKIITPDPHLSRPHIISNSMCYQTPFDSNITLTPRESRSREAAAERNKEQAATLRIASNHLGVIAEKGTDMFSEVKF